MHHNSISMNSLKISIGVALIFGTLMIIPRQDPQDPSPNQEAEPFAWSSHRILKRVKRFFIPIVVLCRQYPVDGLPPDGGGEPPPDYGGGDGGGDGGGEEPPPEEGYRRRRLIQSSHNQAQRPRFILVPRFALFRRQAVARQTTPLRATDRRRRISTDQETGATSSRSQPNQNAKNSRPSSSKPSRSPSSRQQASSSDSQGVRHSKTSKPNQNQNPNGKVSSRVPKTTPRSARLNSPTRSTKSPRKQKASTVAPISNTTKRRASPQKSPAASKSRQWYSFE